ncbi:MAG: hypothetical protein IKE43_03940 [Coriobacteriales bacterium]|nr:hypothetical protein [Coriobacteriales bacterium]
MSGQTDQIYRGKHFKTEPEELPEQEVPVMAVPVEQPQPVVQQVIPEPQPQPGVQQVILEPQPQPVAADQSAPMLKLDTGPIPPVQADGFSKIREKLIQEEELIEEGIVELDDSGKIALPLRILGIIMLVGGFALAGVFLFVSWAFISVALEGVEIAWSTSTLVIAIVMASLLTVTAILSMILGIRLLLSKRRGAAKIANVLVFLTIGIIACEIMLEGVKLDIIAPLVYLTAVLIVRTYVDPRLTEERILKKQQRVQTTRDRVADGTIGYDMSGKGYIELNFFNLFWVFVIASILGLFIETVYHALVFGGYQDRAGLLFGPFSPIYGFGAVLMTIALNRIYNRSTLLIFVVSGIIGGAFEYLVSWFMEFAFGEVAWDYSGPWFNEDGTINIISFMNIDGRTSLLFIIFWGILGVLWIKTLLPGLLIIINKIPWKARYVVTTICAILLVVDGVMTLQANDCWYERMSGKTPSSQSDLFYAEHFGDEFMANRFQSIEIHPEKSVRADTTLKSAQGELGEPTTVTSRLAQATAQRINASAARNLS